MALPHPEARLPIHQGSLSRLERESRMAADRFCSGQSLPTPRAPGSRGGLVSPKAGIRPSEMTNVITQHSYEKEFSHENELIPSSLRIRGLIQRFPRKRRARTTSS